MWGPKRKPTLKMLVFRHLKGVKVGVTVFELPSKLA
jgi:hypothetical protein